MRLFHVRSFIRIIVVTRVRNFSLAATPEREERRNIKDTGDCENWVRQLLRGHKRGPYRRQVSPLKGKTRTVSVKFFEKPEVVPEDLQRNDEDRRGVNSFLLPLRNTFEILWTTRGQGAGGGGKSVKLADSSQLNARNPERQIPDDTRDEPCAPRRCQPDNRALEIYPRWNRRKAATSHWTFPHRRFLRAARFESDTRTNLERRERVTV